MKLRVRQKYGAKCMATRWPCLLRSFLASQGAQGKGRCARQGPLAHRHNGHRPRHTLRRLLEVGHKLGQACSAIESGNRGRFECAGCAVCAASGVHIARMAKRDADKNGRGQGKGGFPALMGLPSGRAGEQHLLP